MLDNVEKAKQPLVKIYHYHCNHLGTPQELSDDKGDIVWLSYDRAWGGSFDTIYKRQFIDNFAITQNELQPIKFQGQSLDAETGLYYNRFRYYDSDVGMFISRDPIELLGGFNVFAYAPNPVMWIDPWGLTTDWGKYLEKDLGVPKPTDMYRPHAHHIVFKEGSEATKSVIAQSKAILEEHKIDWLHGRENLVWAPNRGHSVENAVRVLEALQDAHQNGNGTKQAVVDALKKMGGHFADGSIENILIKRHSITDKGKKIVTCTT